MGRHRELNAKRRQVQFRLSMNEYAMVQIAAKETRKTVSDWLRELALKESMDGKKNRSERKACSDGVQGYRGGAATIEHGC